MSQLSICCTRNGVAKVITELSGSPHRHVEHLKLLGTQKLGLDCAGDASVQNCLELATRQLRDVPPYGHREVLFVMTSLTTCDPGDVFEVGKMGRRLDNLHISGLRRILRIDHSFYSHISHNEVLCRVGVAR